MITKKNFEELTGLTHLKYTCSVERHIGTDDLSQWVIDLIVDNPNNEAEVLHIRTGLATYEDAEFTALSALDKLGIEIFKVQKNDK